MNKLSIIVTSKNITVVLDGKPLMVSKSKNPKLFKKLKSKAKTGDNDYFIDTFTGIQKKLEKISRGVLEKKGGKVVIKGTNVPMPEAIIKKFRELEERQGAEEFLALMNFWKKLALNPSKRSREELFDFIMRWDIPLTESGNMVLEKGVAQKVGAEPGTLVDCHSGTIDNSIGQRVSMPREEVDSDSSVTCSFGLHCSAPKYVREVWPSDIIVEVEVSPEHVVSIPKDYNSTKMRVCQYYVRGYSNQTNSRAGDKIVRLEDFMTTLTKEDYQKLCEVVGREETGAGEKNDVVTSVKILEKEEQTNTDIENMTAKEIVDYVKEKYDYNITFSLKSKKSIVKKALEIEKLGQAVEDISNKSDEEEIEIDENMRVGELDEVVYLSDKTKDDLDYLLYIKFNDNTGHTYTKDRLLQKLTRLYNNAGYIVK